MRFSVIHQSASKPLRVLLVRIVLGERFLPRPAPVDLELHGKAEKGPDQDEETEHHDVLHGRGNDDGADDVTGDKELQGEEDGSAEVLAELLVARAATTQQKADHGDYRTNHDDQYANGIHTGADDVHDVAKVFHGSFGFNDACTNRLP